MDEWEPITSLEPVGWGHVTIVTSSPAEFQSDCSIHADVLHVLDVLDILDVLDVVHVLDVLDVLDGRSTFWF